MAFQRPKVSELLVQCHRRCCICHRFCGVKIETDHIVPRDEGGNDSITNAIPVCFECHAEIHSYNDKHPRGRKFHPDELRLHKEQWLTICREHPEIFVSASRIADVGPLNALIDELELNAEIAGLPVDPIKDRGCHFHDEQFLRAIQEGAISVLKVEIRDAVLQAYVAMGKANRMIDVSWTVGEPGCLGVVNGIGASIRATIPPIINAKDQLLSFLSSE